MIDREKLTESLVYPYTNFLRSNDYWQIRKLLEEGNGVWLEIKRSLLNRKQLFTTQGGVDQTKIVRVVSGYDGIIERPPSVDLILDKNGKVKIVVGDGNHRIAVALIGHSSIQVMVNRTFDGDYPVRLIGFNAIIDKIKSELPH